ncbi:MAG: Rrf2 family transcriptional regulator [Candidatus Aenigmarchaeota archaeon]|nr:Rrf2 family transcriptional regulator [Candidatus Aenigmarchaeota archaeon]
MGVIEFCDMLKQTKEFDELEIKIIKAMINLSRRDQAKVTAAMIANETDISVTNAYKYLYALQQKGIVESMAGKNKVFWLARSANPFPRLFSYVTKDYFKKREMFDELAEMYKEFVRTDVIWFGEKMYEQYENNFPDRAAFLFDVAKLEILATTQKFFTDVLVLDALRRAIARGVKVKIISNEIDADRMEGLKKIGIEIRLGRAWPYLAVVDGMHGITVDRDERGLWFLNCNTDYKNQFEEMWEKAEEF